VDSFANVVSGLYQHNYDNIITLASIPGGLEKQIEQLEASTPLHHAHLLAQMILFSCNSLPT
jgi:hypothetical protein